MYSQQIATAFQRGCNRTSANHSFINVDGSLILDHLQKELHQKKIIPHHQSSQVNQHYRIYPQEVYTRDTYCLFVPTADSVNDGIPEWWVSLAYSSINHLAIYLADILAEFYG